MSEGKEITTEKRGSRKLVKCIVCGEILDSSLEICPVCGVDSSFFVPYEEEKVDFQNNTDEKFLILGNGAAGVNAAKAIRERNRTCSIVILSNEPLLTYNRPMLTKSIASNLAKEEIMVYDRQWYQDNEIINILSSNLNELNINEKYVRFDDTEKIIFDKCIYALGAECFIPPIIGSDKEQAIAIRRYTDVKAITQMLPKINRVVVVGGGVLGLEAAWEMHKLGCKVTVLEVADTLMGRQLDLEAGETLGQIIRDKGIDFYLKAHIKEITGDGKVDGVALEDGRTIPCELVIISSGIRPNIALAKEAGIEVGRSIIVNKYMETNKKGIYACGDCAEYEGINYALWAQAMEMGKVAGANATGDVMEYSIAPPALTFHGMDTALFSIGDNGKTPNLSYEVIRKDQVVEHYETYYFVENELVGAILIGDTKNMAEVTDAVVAHKKKDDCDFIR